MDSPDKHSQQGAAIETQNGRPAPGSRFKYVPPPDDPDVQERSTLPGIYRVTFPVCDAWSFGDTCRLFIRMEITGPLESEAPRDIVNELDIADTFEAVREEFMALQVPLETREGLDAARAALMNSSFHMHWYHYLDQDYERALAQEIITANEAEARLHGRSRWAQHLRIRRAPKSQGKKAKGRAPQQEMSRRVIVWATVIRCDAVSLEDAVGYAIAWEASIDDYVGAPLIHQDHVAIHKLRMNKALTVTDLTDLEHMLIESGVGTAADISRAKSEAEGLGLFVRNLVGLDREAAKAAMARFLAGKSLTANQIEFVNLILDHLTEHGVMEAARLYESPFTDLTARGPDGLFTSAQVDELISVLGEVRATAEAA